MILKYYLAFCIITVIALCLVSLKVSILFKRVDSIKTSIKVTSFASNLIGAFVPLYNVVLFLALVYILVASPGILYKQLNEKEKIAEWK